MSKPQLLRIPERVPTADDALDLAKAMGLDNVLILSQKEDGALVLLAEDSATLAHMNWLCDRAKQHLLGA